jgi:hypothetical protein
MEQFLKLVIILYKHLGDFIMSRDNIKLNISSRKIKLLTKLMKLNKPKRKRVRKSTTATETDSRIWVKSQALSNFSSILYT